MDSSEDGESETSLARHLETGEDSGFFLGLEEGREKRQ